jgi:AraC family transcriptional regulator
MIELPRLIRAHNPGGEFPFKAKDLYLSFHLGQSLKLEMRTSDALWSGRSLRGDVKVMLPGEDRTFRHVQGADFAHIAISPALLASFGVEQRRLRPHVILRDRPLRHLFEALLAESEDDSATRLFAEAAAHAIVARLAALNGRPRPEPGRRLPAHLLQRALELLETRLDAELSIAELASACALSASHFSALFKASVGEPPHRYHVRRRVERARELLLLGATPATAAHAVGFFDQSHLARHMRRLIGQSPRQLQRLSAVRPDYR